MSLLAGKLKTHIGFVLDASGSMEGKFETVNKLVDGLVKELAPKSKELDQETRVSIWQFGDQTQAMCYDVDVLRTPSIAEHYGKCHEIGGATALLDAMADAIEDLRKTPEIHGDHAYLLYILTDGQENVSRRHSWGSIAEVIKEVTKTDRWTIAAFVPDTHGRQQMERVGLAPGNIQVWDTHGTAGAEKALKTAGQVTNAYMATRSAAAVNPSLKAYRSTSNLFGLTTNVTKSAVKAAGDEIKDGVDYEVVHVSGTKAEPMPVIKPYIEKMTGSFRLGSAYYELTKPEKVQPYKQLLLMEKSTGKVFSGPEIRTILGLPSHEVKVAPADMKNHTLFIQSMRPNRKLVSGTRVLVMK